MNLSKVKNVDGMVSGTSATALTSQARQSQADCASDLPSISCGNRDRSRGEGVKFERIRRITGYLVGTIDRFNDAKAAEVKERVKHGLGK